MSSADAPVTPGTPGTPGSATQASAPASGLTPMRRATPLVPVYMRRGRPVKGETMLVRNALSVKSQEQAVAAAPQATRQLVRSLNDEQRASAPAEREVHVYGWDRVEHFVPDEGLELAHALRCHDAPGAAADAAPPRVWSCRFVQQSMVASVSSRPTSEHVVVTTGGRHVCVIDCDSGELLKRYTCEVGESIEFTCAAITFLPVRGDDAQAHAGDGVASIAAGAEGTDAVLAVAAVGASAGPVRLLALKHNRCFHVLEPAMGGGASALEFHPTIPRLLIGAASDGHVYIWDIGTPNASSMTTHALCLARIRGHNGLPINALSVCPSGQWLYTAGNDGRVSKWSMPRTYSAQTITVPVAVYGDCVHDSAVDTLVCLNEHSLLSKAMEAEIVVWDPAFVDRYTPEQMRFKFRSLSQAQIAERCNNQHIRTTFEWRESTVYSFRANVSHDNTAVCAGDGYGRVTLYKLRPALLDGEPAAEQHYTRPTAALLAPEQLGNAGVRDVRFSDDGCVLACVTDNGLVLVWRAARAPAAQLN